MTETSWPVQEDIEKPQIHRAIHAAKIDMPRIQKDGDLELGGKTVKFTKMDDIRQALYPVLDRHGINIYVTEVKLTEKFQQAEEPWTLAQQEPATLPHPTEQGETIPNPRKGMIVPEGRPVRDGRIPQTRHWVRVTYDIAFVFVGDGSAITVRTVGGAYDTNSDKAIGKATTAAIKRAFVETFSILDGDEVDPDSESHEGDNRAATTDRREAPGDRGAQAVATVARGGRRTGPSPAAPVQPSDAEVAAADPATGELPPAAPAPDADRLTAAKERVRAAVAVLGYDQPTVNAIATEVTGKATRPEWISKPTYVEKLAKALEEKVEAQ